MSRRRADPAWVFDLDNTLHNASPHIFPHLNRAMTQYLQDHLVLDEVAANRLRDHYWKRYGATLQGLVRHHGTDPRHFLWHTHQFPALERMVLRERGLRAALGRLRGRKIVYSNAPAFYVEDVLRLLGIGDLFDAVYSIEAARFRPKPDPSGFRRLLRFERLIPARCVMVEDSLANLKTARRLGMRTVLISPRPKRVAGVDASLRSVLRLPRIQADLCAARTRNGGVEGEMRRTGPTTSKGTRHGRKARGAQATHPAGSRRDASAAAGGEDHHRRVGGTPGRIRGRALPPLRQ